MPEWMTWLLVALAALNLVLMVLLLMRPRGAEGLREALRDDAERESRELRAEVQDSARGTRQELSQALALFQQTLLTQQGDVARTQNEQIDSFRTQLAAMQQLVAQSLQQATQSLAQQSQAARDAQDAALKRFADAFGEQVATVRTTVEQRLQAIQADNEKKLEQMRATVDEKLHATLEQRLGESFKQVADRLEQVHKGLGEMQTLAADVGGLKQVLSNVKTLGLAGEMQLAALLEQALAPEQYARNVATRPNSREAVEFAIRLPGREAQAQVWLPIDSKFPAEDYERLIAAQDRADPAAVEESAKAIETRIKLEAKTIRDKYLEPPATTDFAILFLPTEGLYAEVLRRPGLADTLQREFRVVIAGPTTLTAILNSLQMGFRTLAIEQRSGEIQQLLGAVKTEFGKFGDVLAKTKSQLETVANSIGAAETRTRQIERKLKGVEAMPAPDAQRLLGAADDQDAQ